MRDLIFGPDDRISGWGRIVADADGQWLDLARAVPLSFGLLPAQRSRRSIQVVGLDPNAVPTGFGPDGSIPGSLTLTGTWDGDVLHVDGSTPTPPAAFANPTSPEWTDPPCAPPAGRWAVVPDGIWSGNLDFELGDLVTSGAAVTTVIFRPSEDRAVLVVSATDPARVEAVLGPQLPGRLCIVPSRWTRAELDTVVTHLREHWDAWAVETIAESCDEAAQASVHVEVIRVGEPLAAWADTVAPGLLAVSAALIPCPASDRQR